MMSSTLGFSRVEPRKIEFIVEDFLSSTIVDYTRNLIILYKSRTSGSLLIPIRITFQTKSKPQFRRILNLALLHQAITLNLQKNSKMVKPSQV
ncbi:hypothetical protein FGO68_gene16845 [Halteria grandinella]|uniref:Uncharacterized protein n=1 Tax=Halteria grandinella TaxID=5974 RepID=A0A8J8NXY8_HALGN|nr:hypothetical protein FGO68_gene16845 [Halteria grandinella]